MAYSASRFLWGWGAVALPHGSIHGVKLLLDEEQCFRYDPSIRAKKVLQTKEKSPVECAAAFIKELLCHLQETLRRRFGPAANSMGKKFVLTVPAVWTDKAKDATFKVAVKAGIPENQLFLLSEPEAAALYTIQTMQPSSIKVCTCFQCFYLSRRNKLIQWLSQKGDIFIVCDAGGGTVVRFCTCLSPYHSKHLCSFCS